MQHITNISPLKVSILGRFHGALWRCHDHKLTRKVVEIIDQDDGDGIENINFILDIGNGKVEELISYNQHLDHLETVQDNDF